MQRKRQSSTELRLLLNECSDVDCESADEIDNLPVEPPNLEVPARHFFLADDDSDFDEYYATEADGPPSNRFSQVKRMPDKQQPCRPSQAIGRSRQSLCSISSNRTAIDVHAEDTDTLRSSTPIRMRATTSTGADTPCLSSSLVSRRSGRLTASSVTPKAPAMTTVGSNSSYTSCMDYTPDQPNFTKRDQIKWMRRGEMEAMNNEGDFPAFNMRIR